MRKNSVLSAIILVMLNFLRIAYVLVMSTVMLSACGIFNPQTDPDTPTASQLMCETERGSGEWMVYQEVNGSEAYTWFSEIAIREVINDLVKYNVAETRAEAEKLFYEGGLQVYLTIDPKIQAVCEDVALNGYKTADGEYKLEREGAQGAVVVMNYNGELLGVAGGLREKEMDLGLNRAVDTVRPPGSAIMPLGAYCLGIEHDTITYSTGFKDEPTEFIDGHGWPNNNDGMYAEGKIPVAQAIARSTNTVAVQSLKTVGVDAAYNFLADSVGISTIDETDKNYAALALGGMTYGVSPYEMCAAYSIFGNDGTFTEKHCYTKVVDAGGEVIIDKESSLGKNYAISPQTSMIMNRALQLVMANGTGVSARPQENPENLPYAGKSGTSDGTDNWFIGMNPYYVCAVWEGFDIPEMLSVIRPHPTQLMFREVMTQISKGLSGRQFPVADGVKTAQYCLDSGDLASVGCPDTATGYYKDDVCPPTCNHGALS